jgi:CRISPR-associated endonuclease Csy4
VGPASALDQLVSSLRLGGMRDHLRWEPVTMVPATAEHRRLRRLQVKSNSDRLRRRQMKRHGLTEAEALARVPDTAVELLRLPFLQVRSASTGQAFRLFLKLGAPQPEASEGQFNAYGLSSCRTVPWF